MPIERMLNGVRKFQTEISPRAREHFEALAAGQRPTALMITCSDSRIAPHLFTQTDPGDLFVIRNAGNLIPPHSAGVSGEAATVEYAVSVLKVPHIIVCGHSHCGAMQGALSGVSPTELPTVASWLRFAQASLERIPSDARDHTPDAVLERLVEANVITQLEHLKTHPCVRRAVDERGLQIHGWVYRFHEGEVLVLDPAAERFVPHSAAPLGADA
jgi:carbonic anhydrase